jgi:hypothetical protein
MDALNFENVLEAIQRAKPDGIIHELTAIPENINLKHFEKDFAVTNRLRTEGTDHFLAPQPPAASQNSHRISHPSGAQRKQESASRDASEQGKIPLNAQKEKESQ